MKALLVALYLPLVALSCHLQMLFFVFLVVSFGLLPVAGSTDILQTIFTALPFIEASCRFHFLAQGADFLSHT